jgi:hypothetical protein
MMHGHHHHHHDTDTTTLMMSLTIMPIYMGPTMVSVPRTVVCIVT